MDLIENTWKKSEQDVDVAWLSPAQAQRVMAFHREVPEYAPTPLRSLDALAAECGVKALLVKDESSRFGL